MNPARNRREFISATEQIGDKDSLQETGHHQGQAEGEEHIWRRVSDTRWGHNTHVHVYLYKAYRILKMLKNNKQL